MRPDFCLISCLNFSKQRLREEKDNLACTSAETHTHTHMETRACHRNQFALIRPNDTWLGLPLPSRPFVGLFTEDEVTWWGYVNHSVIHAVDIFWCELKDSPFLRMFSSIGVFFNGLKNLSLRVFLRGVFSSCVRACKHVILFSKKLWEDFLLI